MLPSQNLQDRGLPSAIGSDKKATIASVESEGEIIDEGLGTRRRMAVDSRVGESEGVDDDGGGGTRHRGRHFAEWRIGIRSREMEYKRGIEGETVESE